MSKVVNIATLYGAYNYGCYLQAWSTGQALKKLGLEPAYIDIYKNKAQNKARLKTVFNKKNLGFKKLCFALKKKSVFDKFISKLNVVDRKTVSSSSSVLLGSDEIWNVKNSTFYNDPVFFGGDCESENVFSYAPSCGNSTLKELQEYFDRYGVGSFIGLGVRDAETKSALESYGVQSVTPVIDPAFLSETDFCKPVSGEEPYIAVYSYGLSQETVDSILSYAKENGYQILSLGFFNAWCDKSISCSPFEFVSYLRGAEAVFTDTFHGSVFCVKHSLEFFVPRTKKAKLLDLLDKFDLLSRQFSSYDELLELSCQKINYEYVSKKLSILKKQSLDYLVSVLSNV